MKRIYISGPIAGHPDARAKFAAAAMRLRVAGEDNGDGTFSTVEVVNPFHVDPPEHPGQPCPPGYEGSEDHRSSCHMRADLRALLDCDVIAMLPGWENSRGAVVELAVAKACGMEVREL